MRTIVPVAAGIALAAAMLLVVSSTPSTVHAQAPTCDLRAETAFGASAGTLNTPMGVIGTCSEAGTYELHFPGGRVARGFLSEDGEIRERRFTPICKGGPWFVEAHYTGASGTWHERLTVFLQSFPGGPEDEVYLGGPPCDVLLQRGFTSVTWEGAVVSVAEGLQGVLYEGDLVPGAELVTSVWLYVGGFQRWLAWSPELPPSLLGFTLLVPGTTYYFVVEGSPLELMLTFPSP